MAFTFFNLYLFERFFLYAHMDFDQIVAVKMKFINNVDCAFGSKNTTPL